MEFKLPPCTCADRVPDGRVCGRCHAGMEIPRSYYPDLAKTFPTAVGSAQENTADKLLRIKGGYRG